jgi:hypothetical protein
MSVEYREDRQGGGIYVAGNASKIRIGHEIGSKGGGAASVS